MIYKEILVIPFRLNDSAFDVLILPFHSLVGGNQATEQGVR